MTLNSKNQINKVQLNQKPDNTIQLNTGDTDVTIAIAAKMANTVDYTSHPELIRNSEKSILSNFNNIAKKNIIFMHQIHSNDILILDTYPENDLPVIGEADALITPLSKLCIVIRTADCVPVFILDKKKKILAAVHSGWKGTKLDITGKTIKVLKEKFSSSKNDIYAYILPSISPDSYEIQNDVADLFPKGVIRKNNKKFLNLWEIIENSLLKQGIPAENIQNTKICTLKDNNFFSHRRKDKGRNLNFGFISS